MYDPHQLPSESRRFHRGNMVQEPEKEFLVFGIRSFDPWARGQRQCVNGVIRGSKRGSHWSLKVDDRVNQLSTRDWEVLEESVSIIAFKFHQYIDSIFY